MEGGISPTPPFPPPLDFVLMLLSNIICSLLFTATIDPHVTDFDVKSKAVGQVLIPSEVLAPSKQFQDFSWSDISSGLS